MHIRRHALIVLLNNFVRLIINKCTSKRSKGTYLGVIQSCGHELHTETGLKAHT